jgi:membrane-associated protein
MFDSLKQLLNPESIIHLGGLGLLLFVIFAETGLFIGFFLPGDSLVFLAGVFCVSDPKLLDAPVYVVLPLMMLMAVTGNIAGYWFGRKTGPKLFTRDDSFLFKKKHLETTKSFYDRQGGKALVLGRFLPVIRTFAPILAGVIKVDFKIFMLYNIVGAITWIGSVGGIGYYLGVRFPQIKDYLGYIVVGLIVVTAIPVIRTYQKEKSKKA